MTQLLIKLSSQVRFSIVLFHGLICWSIHLKQAHYYRYWSIIEITTISHVFSRGIQQLAPSLYDISYSEYTANIQISYPFFSFHPTTVSTLWSMYSICLAVLQPLCLALRSRPPCIPPSNVYIISHQRIEADIPIHTAVEYPWNPCICVALPHFNFAIKNYTSIDPRVSSIFRPCPTHPKRIQTICKPSPIHISDDTSDDTLPDSPP